jgi:hypothetical protein
VIKVSEIEGKLKELTEEERNFLNSFGLDVRLRKLMSSKEIKMANNLYKRDFLEKGRSADRFQSVVYHVDSAIYSRL